MTALFATRDPGPPKIALWDFQHVARDALREGYAAGYRCQLLVMPTGAGKTTLFAWITRETARRGKRVLVVVHRAELLNQASRRLEAMGVPHGLIAPGISWRPERVQVASKDTLIQRMKKAGAPVWAWLAGLDLAIFDEAHHCTPTNGWGHILAFLGLAPGAERPAHLEGRIVRGLGVTATPERLDGQGLGVACGGPFERLVLGPSPSELVTRGFLARPILWQPEVRTAPADRMRGGDFDPGQLAERLNGRVIGNAVEHYRRHVQGAPAIVFCPTLAKAEDVAEQFRLAGVPAAMVEGDRKRCPPAERSARIRDLERGELKVLTNVMLFSEGTDIPHIAAVFLLRETASLALYLQMVGRGGRIAPGKSSYHIFDHVNLRERFGLPDEDRPWTLDAQRRKARAKGEPDKPPERREQRCDRCRAWHRPAPSCPQCGYRYPMQATLEYLDGELRPAETEQEQYERYARGGLLPARSLDQWLVEAKRRGYKPGWARHRFEWQQKKIAAQSAGGGA